MKKLYCLLLFIGIFLSIPETSAKPGFRKFYKKCDTFYASYAIDGKVNYTSLKKDRQSLDELIAFISAAKLDKLSTNELKAFYINTYNLLVISQIVNFYPIESPYQVPGFFDQNQFIVSGESLTLNQIEEDKLLKTHRDIKSVFALCSGTVGSFPLSTIAYRPARLDKDLASRMKKLANDEKFIRVKKNSSKILCCEAFIRCSKLGGQKELLENLKECRGDSLPVSYNIDYYPSNHSLNILK